MMARPLLVVGPVEGVELLACAAWWPRYGCCWRVGVSFVGFHVGCHGLWVRGMVSWALVGFWLFVLDGCQVAFALGLLASPGGWPGVWPSSESMCSWVLQAPGLVLG